MRCTARSVRKQKLALEREQFDTLQKARNEQSMHVLRRKGMFDSVTATFKELQPKLQGKERLETELKYLEAEKQNIKDSLEVKSVQIAGKLTPKERKLEDDELGEKSPDLDVLDRQIDLARTAMAQTEVHAPLAGRCSRLMVHAGEVSSGPLLALGEVSAMAAIAEVFQTDIPRLKIGDTAVVQVLDEEVAGRVTRLGTMVAREPVDEHGPEGSSGPAGGQGDDRPGRFPPGRQARQHGGGSRHHAGSGSRSRSRSHGHVSSLPPMNHSPNVTGRPGSGSLAVAGCATPRTPPLALRNVVHGGRRLTGRDLGRGLLADDGALAAWFS